MIHNDGFFHPAIYNLNLRRFYVKPKLKIEKEWRRETNVIQECIILSGLGSQEIEMLRHQIHILLTHITYFALFIDKSHNCMRLE